MDGDWMSDLTLPQTARQNPSKGLPPLSKRPAPQTSTAPNFASLLQSVVSTLPSDNLTNTLSQTQSIRPNLVTVQPTPSGSDTEATALTQLMDLFIRAFLAQYGGQTSASTGSSTAASSLLPSNSSSGLVPNERPAVGTYLSPEQLQSVTRQATQIAGVPDSWIEPLTKIAMNESSGQVNAINQDLTGDNEHAMGLMQTEPTTFQAYAAPGLSDINHPLDNMVAAIRYIQSRYGDPNVALQKSLHGGY